ncbi:MAG: cache domain-containing protein, partial [Rhodospirillales bacterium]|nr:cache domain-containing protein [Rhodospirillales bacterium]
MFLDKLKIGPRLMLIVAGTVIGMLAVGGYSLYEVRVNLMEDRKIKTQHVVDTVVTLVSYYQSMEVSGEVTREEAQKAAFAAVEKMRYDEKEYFWLQNLDNEIVMHPIKPALNGQNMDGKADENGVKLFEEMVSVVKKDGEGFVNYVWPKPGSETAQPKVSFVKGFAPWGWIVGSGIYVDDVNTIFMKELTVIGSVGLLIMLLVIGGSLVISRGITKPLSYITENMQRLSEGDKEIEVRFTDQNNEIGDLSRTMDVFLEKTLEMDRMQKEQQEAERRAEEEKRAAMNKMADNFEASVGQIVNQVSSASTELQSSSES